MASITPDSRQDTAAAAASKRLRALLLSGCVGLIIYGTLFPFTGWRMPNTDAWFFNTTVYHDISTPDVLANILLYMPFGFLLVLPRRRRVILPCLLAALVLSLSLETAQAFIPGRVSSLLDTALNVSGAGLGALAALLLAWPRTRISRSVLVSLQHDRVAWLGVAALAAWACAQLLPFVPSLDVGNLKAGFKPLWHALQGAEQVNWWRCLVYVTATAALAVTGSSILRTPGCRSIVAMGLLAILPLKGLMIGRQLSPEAFIGTLAGVTLGMAVQLCGYRRAAGSAALLIVVYILAEALQPGGPGTATHAFNWIPLQAQLLQPVNGLANMADTIWPMLALACLCRRLQICTLWYLLPAVALLLFGVEWAQHWVPGRYPDITTVLLGTVAWAAAAAYSGRTPARTKHSSDIWS